MTNPKTRTPIRSTQKNTEITIPWSVDKLSDYYKVYDLTDGERNVILLVDVNSDSSQLSEEIDGVRKIRTRNKITLPYDRGELADSYEFALVCDNYQFIYMENVDYISEEPLFSEVMFEFRLKQ